MNRKSTHGPPTLGFRMISQSPIFKLTKKSCKNIKENPHMLTWSYPDWQPQTQSCSKQTRRTSPLDQLCSVHWATGSTAGVSVASAGGNMVIAHAPVQDQLHTEVKAPSQRENHPLFLSLNRNESCPHSNICKQLKATRNDARCSFLSSSHLKHVWQQNMLLLIITSF